MKNQQWQYNLNQDKARSETGKCAKSQFTWDGNNCNKWMDRVRTRLMYLDCTLSMLKSQMSVNSSQVIIQQTTKYKWGKTEVFLDSQSKRNNSPKNKKIADNLLTLIIRTDLEKFSVTFLAYQWILSEWGCRQNESPNSWYKHHNNPQVIHMTPVHQLKSESSIHNILLHPVKKLPCLNQERNMHRTSENSPKQTGFWWQDNRGWTFSLEEALLRVIGSKLKWFVYYKHAAF